jgi:hypothetical protein
MPLELIFLIQSTILLLCANSVKNILSFFSDKVQFGKIDTF